MKINLDTPVVSTAETLISAPIEVVWKIQTDINNWSRWNPEVKNVDLRGPLVPGTKFTWKANGLPIKSVLREVDPKHRISWKGKSLGVRAIHTWTFKQQQQETLVQTEESLIGLLVALFRQKFQKLVDETLEKNLAALKTKCETRKAG